MTKQQSLLYAIKILTQQPPTKSTTAAIQVLTKMAASCVYIKWTKESVIIALDKWKSEHNRNPTVTDLSEPDMPKGDTIKKLFNVKPSVFLSKYYPSEQRKTPKTKYNIITPEEYKEIFLEQYHKHKPTSSKQYDNQRDINTPCWTTIALHNGVSTWNNLISKFGVEKYYRKPPEPIKREYTVTTHNISLDRLSDLLEERNKELKKLTNMKF